jgi:hypothetical protein
VSRPHRLSFALSLSLSLCLGAGLSLAGAGAARAQSAPPLDVRWGRDGAITGLALAGTALAALIPVDRTAVWQRQLLPIDDRLEGRFSQSAASTSDLLAGIDVVTPLGLLYGQGGGLNDANGKRLLLYTEAIAINTLVNGLVKYTVGRPRPYVYNADPRMKAYAERQGKDSHLSFFSGHASTTFTAAVAGSYLYGQAAADAKSRAAVWGFELALAGATADLRTRAGKHFYSDVIVGALVGTAIGFLVPRLHGGPHYSPSAGEWVVIGAAPVVGVVVAQLLPFKQDVVEPLGTVALPFIAPGGGGLMLARAF